MDTIANVLVDLSDQLSKTTMIDGRMKMIRPSFIGLKPCLRNKSTVTLRMKSDGWCPEKLAELWSLLDMSTKFHVSKFGRLIKRIMGVA